MTDNRDGVRAKTCDLRYWQRFFTYCSDGLGYLEKQTKTERPYTNNKNTIAIDKVKDVTVAKLIPEHTRTHRIESNGREYHWKEKSEEKALRQNFIQYKMLIESLKSIFWNIFYLLLLLFCFRLALVRYAVIRGLFFVIVLWYAWRKCIFLILSAERIQKEKIRITISRRGLKLQIIWYFIKYF